MYIYIYTYIYIYIYIYIYKVFLSIPQEDALTPAMSVQGNSGFRVQGSGFRVQGSVFRVEGSGFRVQGRGWNSARSATTKQNIACRLNLKPYTLNT